MTRPLKSLSIICLFLTASCRLAAEEPIVRPVKERVDPPAFTLRNLDGKKFSLSDFKGKVVLLDFWATWCPPCRQAIPQLVLLSEKFKGKNLVILGITLDEDPKDVPEFVKKFKIPYTVLLAGNTPIQPQYGVESIPAFVLLDKSLRVADATLGYSDALPEIWTEQINFLLKEKSSDGLPNLLMEPVNLPIKEKP